MLAYFGGIHGPPQFQLLEVTNPTSSPSRVASRTACPMAWSDSGPMKAGPAGTIFCGSCAPTSKMYTPPIPLALSSSSSRVICALSVSPLIHAQYTAGRADRGGSRNPSDKSAPQAPGPTPK